MALTVKPRELSLAGGAGELVSRSGPSDAVRKECAERASAELARLYARRKALVLELHEVNERIADLSTIEMATFARSMRQCRDAADLTTETEDMPE